MANVLIVAHLLIVLALIAVILLQRSEGGGLGMGGGNAGGLMTVRGSANVLTRTTAILAVMFFATSIGLTILSELDNSTSTILERAADPIGEGSEGGGTMSVLDALEQMQAENVGSDLPVPQGTAEDAPEPAASDLGEGIGDDLGLPVPTDAGEPADTQTQAPGQ